MAKVVTRTWFSKKKGTYVTKTYEYEHKSKKSLTLVDNRGRVMKKNVNKFKESIMNNTDFTSCQKIMLLADVDVEVAVWKENKTNLTVSGFLGMQEQNSISRFLTNAGWSVEEFANAIGVDEEEVLDESNWNDGLFYVGDRTFKFNWTYTGNFYEEI